jgi:DNA polymerase V
MEGKNQFSSNEKMSFNSSGAALAEHPSAADKLPAALNLAWSPVSAGFPSPAEDHAEQALDLNEHLIKHPAATFFVRVDGDSMIGAGIHSGDMLIVDRALAAESGSVVVAVVDGEFTVKRLLRHKNRLFLVPENTAFKPIEILDGMDFQVWGVVAHAVHAV